MAKRIVVLGGGAAGLMTAEILGRSGHDVVVIERDVHEPPESDDDAWDDWERPGVNQFRQPHGLLSGGLHVLSKEIPELLDELNAIDTVTLDIADFAPEGVDRTNLPDMTVLGLRRTTFERRLRRVTLGNEQVTVRWGTEPVALTVDKAANSEVPVVTGVETSDGCFAADLVIDASGRRTSVPGLLAAHGIPHEQTREPDGFTYFSRWFRVPQDIQGQPIGMVGMAPGVAVLQFPSDGRTVGVALVASMSDKPIRRLREVDTYMRFVNSVPSLAALLEHAEPLTDVIPMGSIQNRSFRLAHEGRASVAGIACIGDSAVSTNPSLGRGISLAARTIATFRDRLANDPSAVELAEVVNREFDRDHLAWLTDAIHSDRRMRNIFDAARTNTTAPRPDDPRTKIARAAALDADIWTEWAPVFCTYQSPADVVANDDLIQRAEALSDEVPPPQFLMTRDELETLLSA